MGIAVALVVLVYLALAALLLAAVVPLGRAVGLIKSKRGVRVTIFLTCVLILWPVWTVLASHAYFRARCATAAGVFGAKPLSTPALIINDYGVSHANGVIDGKLQCFDDCKSLASFFSLPEAAPLVSHRVAIEARLLGLGGGKFARYWLTQMPSDNCFTTVAPRDSGKPPMCVAGQAMDRLTAQYEFVDKPLEVCEGSQCAKTPNKHEFLDVQRYEHHLLQGTAVVARVVAFQRGNAESLLGWQACPFEARAYGTWARHFMYALFPE